MGYAIKKQSWRIKNQFSGGAAVGESPALVASSFWLRVAFSATLFISAALLFIVEPMVAKMLLPFLGGAPAVWTTCMVFFQAMLLGGYIYAHIASSRLSLHNQTIFHFTLIVLSVLFVPVGISGGWQGFAVTSPILSVIFTLVFSVGLPFFTLSASAPLLQHWFARSGDRSAENPYFLYTASNLGSLIALVSYPTLLEPGLGLSEQSTVWGVGFSALAALVAFCIHQIRVRNLVSSPIEFFAAPAEAEAVTGEEAPSFGRKARWVALAFVPSSLMLGVTTYFTTDIATIPMLWTAPLAIYLFSFILVFSKLPAKVHSICRMAMPVAVIALLYFVVSRAWLGIAASLTWHMGTFFLVAMVFHGELAATRPGPKYLTAFYLWMSFGGMLGGVFNALVAPNAFKTAIEYTVVLVAGLFLVRFVGAQMMARYRKTNALIDVAAAAIIGGMTYWFIARWPLAKIDWSTLAWIFGTDSYRILPVLTYGIPAAACAAMLVFRRPSRLALAVGAFVTAGLVTARYEQPVVALDRSFFGVLKVSDDATGEYRTLVNGTTLHGRQHRDPALAREPLTYYHKNGPVGQIFQEFSGDRQKPELAFVGLGTGTLASYGQPGQHLTFFEIDKAVVKIATEHFTFLKDCRAKYDIVLGDARLKLAEEPSKKFGLMLVDAFSSDAIPVHMLTKEALEMYFDKLDDEGVVAIHTSNRYLELEPILGRLAKEQGLKAFVNHDNADNASGKFASTWVVVAREVRHLGKLQTRGNWVPLEGFSWTPIWSDNFTSLFEILK